MPGLHRSRSCTEAIPASRSPGQENETAERTHETSGPSSPASFAYYDPASSSLRMSQHTLLSDSSVSSLTLPEWGWMRNGELYEPPTLERLTNEQGSSLLLPTPTARDSVSAVNRTSGRQPGSKHKDGVTLTDLMRLVHTNQLSNGGNGSPEQERLRQLMIEEESLPSSWSG